MINFLRNTSIVVVLFLTSLFNIATAQNIVPKVVSGSVQRIENFESKFVTTRHVDIWLPQHYNRKRKYAVLYMHDGQMLFDSSSTWNKQEWKVDEIASELMDKKVIRDFIVVGIWNGGDTRYTDYFPQKVFDNLSQAEQDSLSNRLINKGIVKQQLKINSDNYLKFLVKELKPFIDSAYSVNKDKNNTFIAGSSMGGLISMYAICEYPQVFGGAACMSTHWIGGPPMDHNPIPGAIINYLQKKLLAKNENKIYFDCGNRTLDEYYPPYQKQVDSLMIEKKFSVQNWQTMYFPGEDHTEWSWSRRLDIPFRFLLTKP